MARDMLNSGGDDSLIVKMMDIIRRRRILAVAVFATVLAAAISFARYLPDLYKATALVLVERPVSDQFVRTAVSGELESRLHVIKQEILSRDRLTDLIERFNLYPEMRQKASMEEVLMQMRQDVEVLPSGPEQVSGRTRTVSFTLSYTGATAQNAAEVTNAIASFYVTQNDRMRSEEAVRTMEFLREQLNDARRQLGAQEQAMRSYTATYIGELPQQVGVNLATLERLNAELRMNADRQLATIDQRERILDGLAETSALARGAGATSAEALSQDVLERLKQIEQMRTDLAGLESKFTDRHPDVVAMRERISNLEREVEVQKEREAAERRRLEQEQKRQAEAGAPITETPVAPGTRRRTLEALDAEMAQLQKDEAAIRQQIATYESRLEATPGRQQDYNLITRDYQAAKDLYDSLLKRYEEAQFAASIETDRQGERFRILEPALAPSGPAAPNRLRLMLLGLLLALGAAALAVIAREQLDPSFHSVDEVREFTTVPVIATIPTMGKTPASARLKTAFATVSVVAAIGLVATLSAYLARGNEQIVRMLERAG